jgi:hypothetical protein
LATSDWFQQLALGLMKHNNKHNEILLELALGVRQHTPKLKNPTSKIDFQSYITPKIINSLNLSKKFLFPLTRLFGFTTSFL